MTEVPDPILRIGIDVGGTNTDAVLMSGHEVLASSKQATSADVSTGVSAAIEAVLNGKESHRHAVKAVMIGTTHFVNALVQRVSLTRVHTLRVGLPMGSAIPPMVDWPEDLRSAVSGSSVLVAGGAYYTGQEYIDLDESAIRAFGRSIAGEATPTVAISSVFAPIRPDIEQHAAELVHAEAPGARITLSHELGGLGLIERENAAILNASLCGMADRVVSGLERSIEESGLAATLYVSHNDGTLMSVEQVRRLPIFACAAGPTNSIRGAALLSGLEEAIVVDVGGTTTDIGILVKGLARETSATVELGGVKSNFAMPDVLSIALGGGTEVHHEAGKPIALDTRSVGFRLREAAQCFGGSTLTATDLAVASGWMKVGAEDWKAGLSHEELVQFKALVQGKVADAVDQVKLSASDLPVIAVGGGAPLIRDGLHGASEVLRPAYGGVANAIGAAIAQVGGRVKRLFDYEALGGRAAALEQAEQEARSQAIDAGAIPDSIRTVEIEEFPMPYMETAAVDLRVRVVGDLDLQQAATST